MQKTNTTTHDEQLLDYEGETFADSLLLPPSELNDNEATASSNTTANFD